MNLIFIFLAWGIFSAIEGISEGGYWQFKFECENLISNFKGKEHSLWTLQRFIVVLFGSLYLGSFWYIFLFALTFPFIHDGFYYWTRNYLSHGGVYRKGFWSFSKTSTAWFTKYSTPFLRTLYFIIGLIIIIYLTIK